MKVLHVYKTFLNNSMGGVEQVIAQLTSSPSSRYQYAVLSLAKQPKKDHRQCSGIKNYEFKENFSIASNAISFDLLMHYPSVVASYDVLHYHFPWPFGDLLQLIWKIKKPFIVTYHSDIVRQKTMLKYYRPMMNAFLKKATCVVATSPAYADSSEVLQAFSSKVKVIPIGLNQHHYPSPSAERLAYWRSIVGDRFFLFVGVMRYYKGLHILLDALRDTDFPVVLVGDGPMAASLKTQAKQYGLKNVHFLGALPEEDKVALLLLAYAMVFPSHLRSEAFGVSLLEGAMFGKPLISCEIGTGTSYINLDQTTGYVVPPEDPMALKQAMALLWADEALALSMGRSAYARYQALFTQETMVRAYESLYDECLVRRIETCS